MEDPKTYITLIVLAFVVVVLALLKQEGFKNSVLGGMLCDINGEISSTRIMSVLSVLGGLGVITLNDNPQELATPLSVLFGSAFGGKAIQRHFEKRK